MIPLPSKQKLIVRRKALYDKLDNIIQFCSIEQVEETMREIHRINMRIRTYFVRKKEE